MIGPGTRPRLAQHAHRREELEQQGRNDCIEPLATDKAVGKLAERIFNSTTYKECTLEERAFNGIADSKEKAKVGKRCIQPRPCAMPSLWT